MMKKKKNGKKMNGKKMNGKKMNGGGKGIYPFSNMMGSETIRTVYPQMQKVEMPMPNILGSGMDTNRAISTAEPYVGATISRNYRARHSKQSAMSFQLIKR